MIRKAKTKWHKDRAKEILNHVNFNPKNAWCAIKEICDGFKGHHKAQTDLKMRKPNREIATNDAENVDIMGEHFRTALNNHPEIDPTFFDKIKQRVTKIELGDPPDIEVESQQKG
jgi:predicted small metal-binding protein